MNKLLLMYFLNYSLIYQCGSTNFISLQITSTAVKYIITRKNNKSILGKQNVTLFTMMIPTYSLLRCRFTAKNRD